VKSLLTFPSLNASYCTYENEYSGSMNNQTIAPTLLLVNYCMDRSDPILSHQFDTVIALANNFNEIHVITTRFDKSVLPSNVKIHIVDWNSGKSVSNAINLFQTGLKIIIKNRPQYLFTHMVPKHSLILAPLAKCFSIRHSMWYAHARKSGWFILSAILVDVIISSTTGSCPSDSKKVKLIGQGIDKNLFPYLKRSFNNRKNFVYFGRMDDSKNVSLIIKVLKDCRRIDNDIKLKLIGDGSDKFQNDSNQDWLEAISSQRREILIKETMGCGTFIHAFVGSLDKVLIEATFAGLAVVTINREFTAQFATFGKDFEDLQNQVDSLLKTSEIEFENIIRLNFKHSLQFHEFQGWVSRLFTAIVSR